MGMEAGRDTQAGQDTGSGRRLSWGLSLAVRFGDPRHRLCRRCRRVAMRGRPDCVWHTRGANVLQPSPGRVASRVLSAMQRRGLIPVGLLALPLWQALGWVRTEARAPMRLALVLAWDHQETAPLAWARLWREARETAACPTRVAPRLWA